MKKDSPWSVFIIVFFILRCLFLVFLIPPWEAPDETAHVAYVLHLYYNHELPSKYKHFLPKTIKNSLSEKRKIFKATRHYDFQLFQKKELFDRNDRRLDDEIVNIASHPPLYYLYLLPFYYFSLFFPSFWSLIFLRCGSIILGALCLCLTYNLTKKIFPAKKTSIIVTVLVSLTPMFTFISSIVNNDIMVVLFFLWSLKLILDLSKMKEIEPKDGLILGLVIGASIFVKPQMLILIPFYLIYLFFHKNLRSASYLIPVLLAFLGLIFIYKEQYFLGGGNIFNYSVQNLQGKTMPFWRYPIEFILNKQPIGIFMSFWGFFGWLDVPMPKWSYFIFLLFTLIGIKGWTLNLLKRTCTSSSVFLVGAFILYVLSIFLFDFQVFVLAHQFVIHGRYLAPVLPLLVAFLTQGILQFPHNFNPPTPDYIGIRRGFRSQRSETEDSPRVSSGSFKNPLIYFFVFAFSISQLMMYATITLYYY